LAALAHETARQVASGFIRSSGQREKKCNVSRYADALPFLKSPIRKVPMRVLTPNDIQAVSGGAAPASGGLNSFFESFRNGLFAFFFLLSGKGWGDLY
jgi:hypothetical protein